MARLTDHLAHLDMMLARRTPAGSLWQVLDVLHDGRTLATLSRESDVWRWLVDRGHLTEADLANAVFGWSTPADEGVEAWRVSYPEALHALLHLHSFGADAYVEHDGIGIRMWVGVQRNEDSYAVEARVRSIAELLRSLGLVVRTVSRDQRLVGVRVYDALEDGVRAAA